MASPDRALATMALIDANARRGRTHLDNFVPFVLEVLRAAGQVLSPGEVATGITQEFGLRIPIQATEAVLKRAAREKLVIRRSNKYLLISENAVELKNLRAEQQRFLREQASLCANFVHYCSNAHAVTLSIDEAEIALYDMIERNTVALLSAEFSGSSFSQPAKVDIEHHFLAADFITYITKADQTAYEWLVAAAKGTMLSAALHFPNELQAGRKFSNTDLYFDAPLLLKLVGLEGEEAELSVTEVVKSARSFGAHVVAFSHSVSEAEGVIFSAVEIRKRGASVPLRSDGVLAYAIRNDLSSAELQVRCARFPEQLASLGVAIRDKPDPIPYLEVDELALTEQLRNNVGYRYDNALYRDVDSLRGIHFLRRRRSSVFIENSRAVLITDNDAVARTARNFFRSEGYEWPIATVISDLATILYLKEPQKSPDIPRIQMVAGAYAALEPGAKVWNAWLAAIDQLKSMKAITSDDIALLCHTEESRRILMQATLGDATKVELSTVQDVLNEARRRVAEPYESKARAYESESIKAIATAQVMSRAADKAESELDTVRADLDDLKRRAAQQEEARAEQLNSIQSSAAQYASKVVTSSLLVLVSIATAWFLLSLAGALPGAHVAWISAAVAIIVFAISTFQQIFGGHIKQWLRPIEDRIARRRAKSLRRFLG